MLFPEAPAKVARRQARGVTDPLEHRRMEKRLAALEKRADAFEAALEFYGIPIPDKEKRAPGTHQ